MDTRGHKGKSPPIRVMDVSGEEEALATLMDQLLTQMLQPPTRQPLISLADFLGGSALLNLSSTPIILPLDYTIPRHIITDVSGSPRIRPVAPTPEQRPPPTPPWAERSMEIPASGKIRLLDPPPTGDIIEHLWDRDRTYTEWQEYLTDVEKETTPNEDSDSEDLVDPSTLYPHGYYDKVRTLFESNQRKRWLARKFWTRLTQRIWRKRTQCNVDLIDMESIEDRDALLLIDTTNRTIYRFHKRDMYNCMLSKISTSDEMLPNPRPPTNPWTNQPLTLGQLIAVSQFLLCDYAAKGRCPPVLFAAFCAAGYDLKRFQNENSSFLSQYAITAYFKDIHDHNRDTIIETALQLLSDAGVSHSPVAMRRFFRASPITEEHRQWLALCRDYTLYINLHIQARPLWYDEPAIHRDVRRTYASTNIEDPAGPRIRLLRNINSGSAPAFSAAISSDLVALSSLMYQPAMAAGPVIDASGSALQFLNNSAFPPLGR